MLMKTDRVGNAGIERRGSLYALLFALASIAVGIVGFGGPLLELVNRWTKQEEYSHGFLIPVIVAWLLWSRREALVASIGRPSSMGPALIGVAAVMHIIGKLSALFFMSQFGFIVALVGITLGIGGYSLLRAAFIPIIFLIFAIPLPYFIDAALSYRLQLISSELGTFFIRLVQIPVFLEGNVIDLGVYKLQVVDACSGLRYLYPLMSLGFLAAYLFQAPFWQRALVFLSTVPITIVMNSFRIGVVGVLVDYFGPQDADGFLHMFEGWIIFLACSGILVLEMYALARLSLHKGFFDVFYPPKIAMSPPKQSDLGGLRVPVSAFVLMCATAVAALIVSTRQEIVPNRQMFAAFPGKLGEWTGHSSSLDAETATYLGLTDYIISDYSKKGGYPVNFYVAYYASQRSGLSPHSPTVCIPGNGWRITSFERTAFNADSGLSLPFNRAIISRGREKQLVYYWFDERGRSVANEYLAKFYLLKDAIFKNRTDGALIRLITPISPTENEADADRRLTEFTQAVVPALKGYLPPTTLSNVKQAMN